MGDLTTCQVREFILFMCKNVSSHVQNATCQRAFQKLSLAKNLEITCCNRLDGQGGAGGLGGYGGYKKSSVLTRMLLK